MAQIIEKKYLRLYICVYIYICLRIDLIGHSIMKVLENQALGEQGTNSLVVLYAKNWSIKLNPNFLNPRLFNGIPTIIRAKLIRDCIN